MVTGVKSEISLADGKLSVSGNCILTDIHDNIILTPAKTGNGAVIGVKSSQSSSRVVFPVGKLEGIRFLALHRLQIWWMTQLMGKYAQELPSETQFLMVEVPQSSPLEDESQSVLYTVFLPIPEGDFRAVLQGNDKNELEICFESGDPAVQEFEGKHMVYIEAGSDPYELVANAVKSVEAHLQTFCHRDKKKMPGILDWFGWCTWDAFYTDVTAEGVEQGIESLKKGGTPPKFVIIDDGWQSVGMDPTSITAKHDNTANMADRLISVKENHKFQKNIKEGDMENLASGLREIVSDIKEKYDLKYVYVWHAIVGYWSGVKPGGEMEQYDPKMVDVILSPGLESIGIHFVLKSIIANRVGLVDPEKVYAFYNDLHSYLASAGIDGVKVDNQSILETLGAGFGGRVKLARKYHEALETSISKNFPNNEYISCMSHSSDGLYSAKKAGLIRASDDFFPRNPASHTIHVAAVSYNTLFLGEFMQPDWDMFHSLHPMAEYHGAARAVGGCPVYVSDKPGNHDFDVLKKLVLPDGSILRANLPGRPTPDCLFSDPTKDRKSVLKIWNMNDFTGVLGVFNCQGASWSRTGVEYAIHDEHPPSVSGVIQAKDVHYLSSIAEPGWTGDSILYSHRGGNVVYLPGNNSLPIELNPREFEIFTVVPVKQLSSGASFAPIGLIKMYNSGGAIKELKYESEKTGVIDLKVRGCGIFGAYSSARPKRLSVDTKEEEFDYEESSGLISFALRTPEEELYQWHLTIEF